MTIERIPETNLTYYLIAYDADGNERSDDPDGLMSQRILEVLRNEPVTDVFLLCQGWQTDLPAARQQYTAWISAMAQCTDDIQQLQCERPAFHPLFIGLHWPSLAWGDEEFGPATSFTLPPEPRSVDDLVDAYARRLVDTPLARAALTTLFTTALTTPDPPVLPENVREAYAVLEQEVGLAYKGAGAAPGADQEGFDADAIFAAAQQHPFAPGGWVTDALLAPLRVLSFWTMKERARRVGETAGFTLLREVQRVSNAAGPVRIHLMGHSFGCIVVSAALGGSGSRDALARPVDSMMLVQGALSLWSYSKEIPPAPGQRGYFHPLIEQKKITGPILTTQSTFDTALGFFYPLGAALLQQVSFGPGDLPKYGGMGTFGIQGPQLDIVERSMLPLTEPYGFEAGKIYNLESSRYIAQGNGPEGAHNDITHPEVAHAFWQAVRVAR